MTPAPKPAPKPKRAPKPLRATKWGVSSKPRTKLANVNPVREAERRKDKKAHYASPEYKAARADALQRSGWRCEVRHLFDKDGRLVGMLLPGEKGPSMLGYACRCPLTDTLEFHETNYGSTLGILRDIQGVICCKADHQYIEATRHSTRKHGR